MPSFRGVVRLEHPSLGGSGSNTWHVRTASTLVGIEIELDALSDMINAFYTNVSNVLAGGATAGFDGVWTQIMDPDPVTHERDAWSVDGIGAGGPLPPANAIVVGWRAQTGGRSGRGRTFLGPITSGALQDDGTVATSVLDTVRVSAEGLVTASTGFNDGAVGVFSPTDNLFRDIVSTRTRDLFAVLRSRRD